MVNPLSDVQVDVREDEGPHKLIIWASAARLEENDLVSILHAAGRVKISTQWECFMNQDDGIFFNQYYSSSSVLIFCKPLICIELFSLSASNPLLYVGVFRLENKKPVKKLNCE